MKKLFLLLVVFGVTWSLREDLDELKDLDSKTLIKALKHEEFQKDPSFSDEDKEFVNSLTEEQLQDLISGKANDEIFDEIEEDEKEKDDEGKKDDMLEDEDDFMSNDEEDIDNELMEGGKEDGMASFDDDDAFDEAAFQSSDMKNDPWGRRRRRRHYRRRRIWHRRRRAKRRRGKGWAKFISAIKKIKAFLKKHGEKIKKGINALRKGIWKYCKKPGKGGKWWCRFGSPKG